MNKRVPLLLSLVGVIVLAASIAYWFLQLYQPPQRPIAAVPVAQMPDPSIDAAATLFGGQVAVASATNYQLTGVVAAGRNSVAIIVADGSPPKALKLGKEVAPGVTLAEVYPRYVMLSDGGVMKRIDLAPDTKAASPMGGPGTPPASPPAGAVPEPQMDAGVQAGHGDVGAHEQPAAPSATNPPLNMGPVPQAARPATPAPVPAPVAPAAPVNPPGSSVTPVGTPSTPPVQMPQPVRSPNAQPVTQAPTSR